MDYMQYRPQMALQTSDEKQMGLFLHLSGLAFALVFPLGIVLPILLWQTQKDKMPALDAHGKPTNELLLIDEILTPDSSRFWPEADYQPGRDQDSFDKQYVRNYLLELVKAKKWAKQPPGPELPADVVANTLAKYVEARDRLFEPASTLP